MNWGGVMAIECAHGDHLWHGGGSCECGERLRCCCGQFVTEDGIEAHLERCPTTRAALSAALKPSLHTHQGSAASCAPDGEETR